MTRTVPVAAACALLLVACTCSRSQRQPPAPKGSAPATRSPDAARRDVAPPALFAALFDKGRAWTYDYEYEYPDHIPFSGQTTMRHEGILRCRVEDVAAQGDVRLSRTRCRLFEEGEDLAGAGQEPFYELGENVYIADARGLWIGDDDACKALSKACAAAIKGPPYLAAEPGPRREEKKEAKKVETTVVQRRTEKVGQEAVQVWCHQLISQDASGRDVLERCFAPQRGLVLERGDYKKAEAAQEQEGEDEEAEETGDPPWSKGTIKQTGELKAPGAAR